MKKKKVPTKLIHIHAKCAAFEIFEQVPESKAVARLIAIRKNYRFAVEHYNTFTEHLVVKTMVVNPELSFYPATSHVFSK